MITTDSRPGDHPDSIRLDLDWRWHRPKRRPNLPKGEPRDDERPIRCITPNGTIQATTTHLPYPDSSLSSVDCNTIFAYVRNDEGLALELARVVRSEGTVLVRVPATGPIAGLDAFNLHRYLVDITKRGLRPFETADIGWRRHYGLDDLTALFGTDQFTVSEHHRYGIAASEILRMSGFVMFRWLRPSRDRYRAVSKSAYRILDAEERIVWKHGFWLEATLIRK